MDTRLITLAQRGDSTAYETLVRQFQDMAVGYAYALIGDIHLAEDAAQEAFISAYYELPMLREPSAFPSWFKRVVFKQADRLRRNRHFSHTALSDSLVSLRPLPLEVIEPEERARLVQEALATLPEGQRIVATLFYMGDYSQREISVFLEIPLATVKTRLFHARKQLKARMVHLMQDQFNHQRPSRDDEFVEKVMRFFAYIAEGNREYVGEMLLENAPLATAVGRASSPLWRSETSALHLAVMYGRKDMIELLLAHGANIHEKDARFGFSVLHQALDLADFLEDYAALEMVDFLLAQGATPDIFVPLWQGDVNGVRQFLEKDATLANAIGPGKATPLCYAFDAEVAQLLLDFGADMWMLLENKQGKTTPLRWLTNRPEVLRFLLEKSNTPLDIFLHCGLGEVERVVELLNVHPEWVHAKIPVSHVLEADLTLLHLAAEYGLVTLAEKLLTMGADVNAIAPAVKNMTPLHLAVWRGAKEVPAALPIDLSERDGILQLKTAIPRLLLQHGADKSVRDSEKQWTPLEWAQADHEDETDRREVIALLLQ